MGIRLSTTGRARLRGLGGPITGGHDEEVVQDDVIDLCKAHQNRRPWHIVILDVIDVGVALDQLVANVVPYNYDQRTRLRGLVRGHTGGDFLVRFQTGTVPGLALFQPRNLLPDPAHALEVGLPRHLREFYLTLT